MAGSDLSPANWPIVRTRGDSMLPEEFTLTIDGGALTPVSAIAQVRESHSRSSTLVLELSVDLATNVVTVGDGDDLDAVTPGVYWWDLQVTNAAYPSGLTIIAGTFQVLDDVSEVVP
jgi:hypothetical protein